MYRLPGTIVETGGFHFPATEIHPRIASNYEIRVYQMEKIWRRTRQTRRRKERIIVVITLSPDEVGVNSLEGDVVRPQAN